MQEMSLADGSVITVSEGQLASKLNDEVVILNLNSGVYFGLDAVGARVWELIQQGSTFARVREGILAEFEVGTEQCGRDLSELLGRMEAEGLVRIEPGT